MDDTGPYYDGLLVDDSLHDPALLPPHLVSLTSMGHTSSSSLDQPCSSSSFNTHTFPLSPCRAEWEWLGLREMTDQHTATFEEDSGRSETNKKQHSQNRPRKRSWKARMATETQEKKWQRQERNRIRMAEKRARETEEERRHRLNREKEYSRRKIGTETDEETELRRECKRGKELIRRANIDLERRIDETLTKAFRIGMSEEELAEEEEAEKRRREQTTDQGKPRIARETPDQRQRRLVANRERMRVTRATKKDDWMTYLERREVIQERLHIMKAELGDKSPLLENDSILATRLAELLRQLAEASRKNVGKCITFRNWDDFVLKSVPPILTAIECAVAGEGSTSHTTGPFVFGNEASYLDYVLFEEMEALTELCPAALKPFPILRGYIDRFSQGIQITTYALMQAGSISLSEDSIDNQSATVFQDPLQAEHLTFDEF